MAVFHMEHFYKYFYVNYLLRFVFLFFLSSQVRVSEFFDWGTVCEWIGNEWGWIGKRCFTEHSLPWWRTLARGPFTETNPQDNPMDTGASRERHMVFTQLRRRRICPRKKFINPSCEQIGNPEAWYLDFR
jgi:hypothetical protein